MILHRQTHDIPGAKERSFLHAFSTDRRHTGVMSMLSARMSFLRTDVTLIRHNGILYHMFGLSGTRSRLFFHRCARRGYHHPRI